MPRPFHNLIYILTIRCIEVSRLNSERLDRPLTRTEVWAVRGHLLACASCRHFRRQAAELRRLAQDLGGGVTQTSARLSDDARRRIAERLTTETRQADS